MKEWKGNRGRDGIRGNRGGGRCHGEGREGEGECGEENGKKRMVCTEK